MLSGKLCLENMHVNQVCLSTQCLSLADQNDKVNALKCDFHVYILYRTHLNTVHKGYSCICHAVIVRLYRYECKRH